MELKINGTDKTFEQETATVTELLSLEKIDMPEMVSVELNGEILDRENFDKTTVKTGDEVEFLYFMGGGKIEIFF